MSKKYYIKTFGCQMNHSDSERFASVVEGIGYRPTESYRDADLVVFNSCSVRQKAEDRILGLGRKVGELKATNPELKIVLTGCMARRTWQGVSKTGSPIQMTQESREEQLQKQMPWVDIVLETKDFGKLPQRLGMNVEFKEAPEHYLSYTPMYKNDFQAFVPISTGCDHFCTYCIVPFARGGEVCRDADSIFDEIATLVASGYKDITLLGQTVNRWINPKFDAEIKQGNIANTRIPGLNEKLLSNPGEEEARDFLQLLQKLDQIPGEYWVSFVSSHPNYMTRELIEFLAQSTHMRPYLHFALQSGSDAILKRMNRRYDVADFSEKTKYFKQILPGVSISTDIIVGFPGETEEQFMETARVMETLEFDMAYLSEFSPRTGTAAGLLKDDIPHAEKERRKTYLNDEVLAKTALKNNKKLVGTKQVVLIEKKLKEGWRGKTASYKDVRVSNSKLEMLNSNEIQNSKTSKTNIDLIGQFIEVEITGCSAWALTGTVIPSEVTSLLSYAKHCGQGNRA